MKKMPTAVSTAEAEIRKEIGASGKGGNVAAAQAIGKRIAEKAKAAGVEKVAFAACKIIQGTLGSTT